MGTVNGEDFSDRMELPMRSSSIRYFKAVDGLRLLASINIVLFHLQGIGGLYDLHEKPQWIFRILKGPAFHASIFFMLGGFIFTIKFAHIAHSFDHRAFLKKRFLELYPLHLFTTLAMIALRVIHELPRGSLDIPKLIFSAFMHLSLLWSVFPFHSFALNRPSWALSAFFLCYLLFGPALKLVTGIDKRRICIAIATCCLIPILSWSLLYGALGTPERLYQFFHIFAPIRFFEFLAGMALARFFELSSRKGRSSAVRGVLNDMMITTAIALVFLNLGLQRSERPLIVYISYHVFMLPLYFVILYGLAIERGVIARVLSFEAVRKTGRSSFYPYLIHIPLISIICYICENVFSYYRFLHRPSYIALFMTALYAGSYFYVNHVRKRKPSGPRKRTALDGAREMPG